MQVLIFLKVDYILFYLLTEKPLHWLMNLCLLKLICPSRSSYILDTEFVALSQKAFHFIEDYCLYSFWSGSFAWYQFGFNSLLSWECFHEQCVCSIVPVCMGRQCASCGLLSHIWSWTPTWPVGCSDFPFFSYFWESLTFPLFLGTQEFRKCIKKTNFSSAVLSEFFADFFENLYFFWTFQN
jgi:hypothetical protein